MYKIYIYILLSSTLFVTSCSQKKDDFNDLSKRAVAEINVSFPNAINDAAAGAYYKFNRSAIGNAPSTTPVTIVIAIPAESGRVITALFARVGSTALNAGSVSPSISPVTGVVTTPAPTSYWISTNTSPTRPNPVSSILSGLNTTTVTITTTLGAITTAGGNAATFHTTAFPTTAPFFLDGAAIFRLVLDDNTEIITPLVRLRVFP